MGLNPSSESEKESSQPSRHPPSNALAGQPSVGALSPKLVNLYDEQSAVENAYAPSKRKKVSAWLDADQGTVNDASAVASIPTDHQIEDTTTDLELADLVEDARLVALPAETRVPQLTAATRPPHSVATGACNEAVAQAVGHLATLYPKSQLDGDTLNDDPLEDVSFCFACNDHNCCCNDSELSSDEEDDDDEDQTATGNLENRSPRPTDATRITSNEERVNGAATSPPLGIELIEILNDQYAKINLDQLEYFLTLPELIGEDAKKLAFAHLRYIDNKLSSRGGSSSTAGEESISNDSIFELLNGSMNGGSVEGSKDTPYKCTCAGGFTKCDGGCAVLAIIRYRMARFPDRYHLLNYALLKFSEIFPAIERELRKGYMIHHSRVKAGLKPQTEPRSGSVVDGRFIEVTPDQLLAEMTNPNALAKGDAVFIEDVSRQIPFMFNAATAKAEEFGLLGTWGTTRHVSDLGIKELKSKDPPTRDTLNYIDAETAKQLGLKEEDCFQGQLRLYGCGQCLNDKVESGFDVLFQPGIHRDGIVSVRVIHHFTLDPNAVSEFGVVFFDKNGNQQQNQQRRKVNFSKHGRGMAGKSIYQGSTDTAKKIVHGVAGKYVRGSYIQDYYYSATAPLKLTVGYTPSPYTGVPLHEYYYGLPASIFFIHYRPVPTAGPYKIVGRPEASLWKGELERLFVEAVQQLGKDATPGPVLRKMQQSDANEVTQNLTRQHVADRLQRHRRKEQKEKKEDDLEELPATTLTQKIEWVGELERLFVEAVQQLGKDATPGPVLRKMQQSDANEVTKNLTRQHVANHLQRHRRKEQKEKKETQNSSTPDVH